MGAKKKPSSARELAPAASPGKKQRISAKEARTVLADMVPKARSAYAIFMSANCERIKESLDSSSGGLLQREVVKECGQASKQLAAEDRATWQAKADSELQAQKKLSTGFTLISGRRHQHSRLAAVTVEPQTLLWAISCSQTTDGGRAALSERSDATAKSFTMTPWV